MRRRAVLAGIGKLVVVAAFAGHAHADDSLPSVHVWKDPNCGCCNAWIAHLRSFGFKVTASDTDNLARLKDLHGVPQGLRSCHTANVNDYFIEGHVPAADILRLLRTKPAVRGLSVPGMPLGSPGMEVPTGEVEDYDVIAVGKDGRSSVFAAHRAK